MTTKTSKVEDKPEVAWINSPTYWSFLLINKDMRALFAAAGIQDEHRPRQLAVLKILYPTAWEHDPPEGTDLTLLDWQIILDEYPAQADAEDVIVAGLKELAAKVKPPEPVADIDNTDFQDFRKALASAMFQKFGRLDAVALKRQLKEITGSDDSADLYKRNGHSPYWVKMIMVYEPPKESPAASDDNNGVNPFKKAVRGMEFIRMAVSGPSKSGKTWSALMLASQWVEGEKRIAVIDTEYSTSNLYADEFDFDCLTIGADEGYTPERLLKAVDTAKRFGYGVLIVDSFSHFWDGTGGILDRKLEVERRMKNPNGYFAWRDVTPLQDQVVKALLTFPGHVIATMRAKTEYELDGGTTPRKVGMAPIQRDGVDYEFSIVGMLDTKHSMSISARCKAVDGKALRPDEKLAQTLLGWSKGTVK